MPKQPIVEPVEAYSLGLARLYRFRRFESDREIDSVFATIAKREVRFARPRDFNDPFDPRPLVVATNARLVRERVEKMARQRREKNLRQKVTPSEAAELLTERYRKTWPEDFRMLCLTAEPDNILQWSHYADGHRGVMIHFDAAKSPIGNAIEVRYSEDYPSIDLPPRGPEVIQHGLATKSVHWRYEREFRLIRFPAVGYSEPVRSLGLKWTDDVATLPPGSVAGITIGAAMPEELRHKLQVFVDAQPSPIEIHQAELHKARFEIVSRKLR